MSDALTSKALIMAGRSLRLSTRSPEALLTALMLPVMLMVVFVYLFGGAVDIGTKYVNYVAPGVLLLCAVTGAATTADATSSPHSMGDRPSWATCVSGCSSVGPAPQER